MGFASLRKANFTNLFVLRNIIVLLTIIFPVTLFSNVSLAVYDLL
jgi:hypothetical protein